jgi:hypothetical protein
MSKQAQPRVWEIHRFDHEGNEILSEPEFRQAVADALMEVETIGHRVGGSFLSVPKRIEVMPDVWITVSWRIIWQSFGPGSQRQQAAQQAPRPRPVEAVADDEDDPPLAGDVLSDEELEELAAS